MEDLLAQWGYAGLFLVSFISATVVPLATEPVVVGLLALGDSPVVVIAVALAGSTLGSLTTYCVGRYGSVLFFGRFASRFAAAEERHLPRARALFDRWGAPIMFLSWLPVIGDAMALVAGAAAVHPVRFIMWVAAGRAARYVVVVAVTLGALSFFK